MQSTKAGRKYAIFREKKSNIVPLACKNSQKQQTGRSMQNNSQ